MAPAEVVAERHAAAARLRPDARAVVAEQRAVEAAAALAMVAMEPWWRRRRR